MLPETLTTALKEWAVVQRSLLEGHQLMLLRKGGIIEDTGDFDLKATQFLIYPNYAHETERAGDLQPCFGDWLHEEEVERRPAAGFVRIEAAAEVTDVIRVDNRETIVKMSPQHIWSRQFIDGRYDWEPYKPIFLLLLRAYRLPEAHVLPILSSYGGCRSWIEIEPPISTVGATPAVSDQHFERRRLLTRKLLED